MQNYFTWTKRGEDAFTAIADPNARRAVLDGWGKLLSRVGGPEINHPDFLLNVVKGNYHHLEYMAKVGFENVTGIERRAVVGSTARDIDVFVRQVVPVHGVPTELEVAVELKSVGAGKRFPRIGEVAQDVSRALRNAEYTPGNLTPDVEQRVIRELTSLLYVFRGNAQVAQRAINQLRRKVARQLPDELKHLASYVRVEFSGGGIPF